MAVRIPRSVRIESADVQRLIDLWIALAAAFVVGGNRAESRRGADFIADLAVNWPLDCGRGTQLPSEYR